MGDPSGIEVRVLVLFEPLDEEGRCLKQEVLLDLGGGRGVWCCGGS